VLVLLAGAGALLGAVPSAAAAPGTRPPTPASAAGEARALSLLGVAARAARLRTYSGTQYVASWRESGASSTVVEVQHAPETGMRVTAPETAGGPTSDATVAAQTDALDERLLPLLAAHYDLALAPSQRCSGRLARVVEARRPGVGGPAGLAGRFWLDRGSGLVLRREVYDARGRVVRSTAFVELDVAAGPPAAAGPSPAGPSPAGQLPPDTSLARLVAGTSLSDAPDAGWPVPSTLPGGLQLFDAQRRDVGAAEVLHLAYSDGLSRLSLFSQPGRLGDDAPAGFRRVSIAGTPVWVRSASPERVVWSGGGRVWTLLSDAPPGTVDAVVTALPHDATARGGLLARLGRGLARLASWLNPFS